MMSEKSASNWNFEVKSQFLLTGTQVTDMVYFFYLQGVVHKYDKANKSTNTAGISYWNKKLLSPLN